MTLSVSLPAQAGNPVTTRGAMARRGTGSHRWRLLDAPPTRGMTVGMVALAFAFVFASSPARAQSVEEFYRGKTINLIIGYSVGGGYDLYGRLVSRHMGKHIPGRPAIVAQNMTGAGR